MSKTAHIIALRSSTVEDLDFGVSDDAQLIDAVLTQSEVWVGPRPTLETNEDFVQVIPYVLLRYGDKYLTYQRGSAGGEARLHAQTSLGIGGHVDLADAITLDDGSIDLIETLAKAAARELLEEVGTLPAAEVVWSTLISMDLAAVDKVHLGFVAVVDVTESEVARFEYELAMVGPTWVSAEVMRRLQGDGSVVFESWSAALLPHLQ